MFQEFWKVSKTLIIFADELQKYHAEIKDIRKELVAIQTIVHALAQQIKHSREIHSQDIEHTKEKINLEHKNHILEVEKRLNGFSQLLEEKSKKRK